MLKKIIFIFLFSTLSAPNAFSSSSKMSHAWNTSKNLNDIKSMFESKKNQPWGIPHYSLKSLLSREFSGILDYRSFIQADLFLSNEKLKKEDANGKPLFLLVMSHEWTLESRRNYGVWLLSDKKDTVANLDFKFSSEEVEFLSLNQLFRNHHKNGYSETNPPPKDLVFADFIFINDKGEIAVVEDDSLSYEDFTYDTRSYWGLMASKGVSYLGSLATYFCTFCLDL